MGLFGERIEGRFGPGESIESILEAKRRRRERFAGASEALLLALGGTFAPKETERFGEQMQRRRQIARLSPFVAQRLTEFGLTDPEDARAALESGLITGETLFKRPERMIPATGTIAEALSVLEETPVTIQEFTAGRLRAADIARQKMQERSFTFRSQLAQLDRAAMDERQRERMAIAATNKSLDERLPEAERRAYSDIAINLSQGLPISEIEFESPTLFGRIFSSLLPSAGRVKPKVKTPARAPTPTRDPLGLFR